MKHPGKVQLTISNYYYYCYYNYDSGSLMFRRGMALSLERHDSHADSHGHQQVACSLAPLSTCSTCTSCCLWLQSCSERPQPFPSANQSIGAA